MTTNGFIQIVTPVLLLAAVSTASAGVPGSFTYCEPVDGELSGDGSNPTHLSFSAGLNCVCGSIGRGAFTPGATDADIFSFSLLPTDYIDSIQLTVYNPSGPVGEGSFLAIGLGDTINTGSAATHLSNMLVSQAGELLGTLSLSKRFTEGFGSASGASGLTSPMPGALYTLWFQEAGQNKVDYEICINVVPEPSTWAFLTLGIGALAIRRRRSC